MSIVYTDGNGSYYQIGNPVTGNPATTEVDVRNSNAYTTQQLDSSSLPESTWTIAPNLTDIGGGVWTNGLLVDPGPD